MSQKIAVYLDEGVDARLFREVVQGLPGHPKRFDRHSFLEEGWESELDLLVIPGGRDVPYHNALRGEPNRRIRRFVEAGGSFLGICAGAYYGSQEVIFEEGGQLEVLAKRELGFFPGRAVGPAYGNGSFRYGTEAGARQARLLFGQETAEVYFNGGCYFEAAEKHPQVEVLATYDDLEGSPAAIISCQVGKGRAILSGVHLEKNPTFLHQILI